METSTIDHMPILASAPALQKHEIVHQEICLSPSKSPSGSFEENKQERPKQRIRSQRHRQSLGAFVKKLAGRRSTSMADAAGDSQTQSPEAQRRTLNSHESPRSTIQQRQIEQDAEPNYEYGDAAPDDYAYDQNSTKDARRKFKYSLSQDDDMLSPQRERKRPSRRASIDAHRRNSIDNYYRRENFGNSPVKSPVVFTKTNRKVSFVAGVESVETAAPDGVGSPTRPTKSAIKKTSFDEPKKDEIDYGYIPGAPDLDFSEPEEEVDYGYGLGAPDGYSNSCAPSLPQREPESTPDGSQTPTMPRRRPSLEQLLVNEQIPTLPKQRQLTGATTTTTTTRHTSIGSSPTIFSVGEADSSTPESLRKSAAFRWDSEPVNKKSQDRMPSGPKRRPSLESESMHTAKESS